MSNKTLSICIHTFNRIECLNKCLNSISMIREKILLKKIKWYNYGRVAYSNFKFKFDKKRLNKYIIYTAPNISYITGYYIQSPMTFIKKKNFQ